MKRAKLNIFLRLGIFFRGKNERCHQASVLQDLCFYLLEEPVLFLCQKSSNLLFLFTCSVWQKYFGQTLCFLSFLFCAGILSELPGLLGSISEEEVIGAALKFLKLTASFLKPFLFHFPKFKNTWMKYDKKMGDEP